MAEFLDFTGLTHFKDKMDSANEKKFLEIADVDSVIADKLTNVYTYKGSVESVDLLPKSGNKVGDVYDVANGMNYAWNGKAWDALGDLVEIDSEMSDSSTNAVQNKIIYAELQKKADKLTSYPTTWGDISDKPTVFDTTWSQITNKPESFPTSWDAVSGRPDYFPTSWDMVTGKPDSFTTDWDKIINKPQAFPTTFEKITGWNGGAENVLHGDGTWSPVSVPDVEAITTSDIDKLFS